MTTTADDNTSSRVEVDDTVVVADASAANGDKVVAAPTVASTFRYLPFSDDSDPVSSTGVLRIELFLIVCFLQASINARFTTIREEDLAEFLPDAPGISERPRWPTENIMNNYGRAPIGEQATIPCYRCVTQFEASNDGSDVVRCIRKTDDKCSACASAKSVCNIDFQREYFRLWQ